MDANLVNPFIEATLSVLETTASTKVKAGRPYLKRETTALGDITGLIRLSGEYNATVALSFTKSSILEIVSKMFGEEISELNDDIKDAVGEISNMVSGQVTNTIASLGESLKAVPSEVILDENHSVPHIGVYPTVAFPFDTGAGEFTIEVCFEKK